MHATSGNCWTMQHCLVLHGDSAWWVMSATHHATHGKLQHTPDNGILNLVLLSWAVGNWRIAPARLPCAGFRKFSKKQFMHRARAARPRGFDILFSLDPDPGRRVISDISDCHFFTTARLLCTSFSIISVAVYLKSDITLPRRRDLYSSVMRSKIKIRTSSRHKAQLALCLVEVRILIFDDPSENQWRQSPQFSSAQLYSSKFSIQYNLVYY
jgi:hypothetical protein